jgi:hypothetical protein
LEAEIAKMVYSRKLLERQTGEEGDFDGGDPK